MNIELRFNKNDVEAKQWIMQHFDVSEEDFVEIRSFNGEVIILAIFIAVTELIKNPKIIDSFLSHPEREVEFDAQGNLLRARGYSVSQIIKMQQQGKSNDVLQEQ